MTSRLTPYTPWISPAKLATRLPLIRISVFWPPRPRSEAVCALNVVAPITLPNEVLPRLLLLEM